MEAGIKITNEEHIAFDGAWDAHRGKRMSRSFKGGHRLIYEKAFAMQKHAQNSGTFGPMDNYFTGKVHGLNGMEPLIDITKDYDNPIIALYKVGYIGGRSVYDASDSM